MKSSICSWFISPHCNVYYFPHSRFRTQCDPIIFSPSILLLFISSFTLMKRNKLLFNILRWALKQMILIFLLFFVENVQYLIFERLQRCHLGFSRQTKKAQIFIKNLKNDLRYSKRKNALDFQCSTMNLKIYFSKQRIGVFRANYWNN